MYKLLLFLCRCMLDQFFHLFALFLRFCSKLLHWFVTDNCREESSVQEQLRLLGNYNRVMLTLQITCAYYQEWRCGDAAALNPGLFVMCWASLQQSQGRVLVLGGASSAGPG